MFAWGGVYSPKDVPIPRLQDATRYVSDPDGVLKSESIHTMDSILGVLERTTGVQTLVVVVEEIEGGDCFQFAQDLGNMHGVGQKDKNNGLVIVLSTEDRCVFTATGSGLEGDMPDAICKRIQVKYMNGHFADDEWNEGLTEGVRATADYLLGNIDIDGSAHLEDDEGWLSFIGGLGLCIAASVGAFLYGFVKRRKCSECKKWKLKKDKYWFRKTDDSKTEYRCICANCGHTYYYESEVKRKYGAYAGSFGSSFGGGGGGGSSYGGGSFSGGGSGSSF